MKGFPTSTPCTRAAVRTAFVAVAYTPPGTNRVQVRESADKPPLPALRVDPGRDPQGRRGLTPLRTASGCTSGAGSEQAERLDQLGSHLTWSRQYARPALALQRGPHQAAAAEGFRGVGEDATVVVGEPQDVGRAELLRA